MMLSSELEHYLLEVEKFPLLWKVLQEGVQNQVSPGFVVGIWEKRRPYQIGLAAVGHRSLIPTPQAMHEDTIFDIASISKVLATATLCGLMVDRGWMSWSTSVTEIFPEYPYPKIQLHHLLAHTAGFPNWRPLWENLWKRFSPAPIWNIAIEERQKIMRELVFKVAPEADVGARAVYSDITFLILGFMIEEITKMPLNQAVKEFVFKPMGLTHAYYRLITRPASEDRFEEVAATEECPNRGGVLQGQVHDDNCWAMGGYGGHAGVFTNAADILHFARALMAEKFLTPETLNKMWQRVPAPAGCERTLGWDTPSSSTPSSGSLFSKNTVGHLGFTGTSLWIDRDAELAVVLLSNRVHPSRENQKIRTLRPQFHDAIRRDLAQLRAF